MLQKLSKCEVKAYSVEIQELLCHSNLCEINFDKMLFLKVAIFKIFESLKLEFWPLWSWKIAQID